jgi:ATP-dependent RNA helicase RhlB
VCVYGGVDYEKQKQKILSGLDILIATPGRLIDYYKQKFFSLKSVQVLVIDEADRMFDMGFIQDLRYILRRMTPFDERLSMLFSATLNFRVLELCYEHMNNPEKIAIEPEKFVVEKIQQSLYHVGLHEKFSLLLGLLKREEGKKVIIFCNTKAWAEKLEFKLRHNGYVASQISGDLHQNKRTKVLDQFKNSEIDILIATDVASRGLHVDDITHVINYDLPQDPEDYVHRIGRTARAGAEGTAITLCCENFAAHLEHVEEYLKQKIPVVWPDEELFLAGKPGGEPPRRKPKPRSSSNSSRPSGNSSSRPKGRPGRPSSSSRRPR